MANSDEATTSKARMLSEYEKHGFKWKTGSSFVPFPLNDINKSACPELLFSTWPITGGQFVSCERLSGHACYGEGWCPLRFTDSHFTPRIGSSGKPRFY